MQSLVLVGMGLGLLVLGANWLVTGAVSLAERAGVSPLLIGLTIVAWGTSAPELVVSVKAGMEGMGGIAIGNVVGSNIFNVLGVMGLVALAVRPVIVLRDATIAVLAGLALLAIVMGGGVLERWHGMALLAGLLAYTLYAYLGERGSKSGSAAAAAGAASEVGGAAAHVARERSVPEALLLVAVGLACLVGGGTLLVEGAVAIARAAGLSEAVIGLTLVAVGTSLPEVATSVVAALRREVDVAVGNVLGSNTFNLLGILGLTAVVGPVAIPPDLSVLDVALAAAVPLLIAGPALVTGRIGRVLGVAMLAAYAGYVGVLLAR